MPGDLCIEALGVPFRVKLGSGIDEDSAAHLREIWSAANHRITDSAIIYRASIGTEWPVTGSEPGHLAARDLRSLESTLSSHITIAAIEERKHDLVMLHGCAVARADGSVFAFVGPSGRGKSTLARSLARIAQYVSDETVGIAEDGRVLPHPKPLSIIDPDAPDGLKTQVAPADPGLLGSDGQKLHIDRVFLLDRRPDALGVSVEPIDLAPSLELLVPQLSYLPSLPRPLHRIAELYDRVGGFAVLSYAEANDVTAAFAAGSLDRDAVETHATPAFSEPPAPSENAPKSSVGFRRLPIVDALFAGDQLCLLRGSSVTVLDGIGPSIWTLTDSLRSLDELAALVVDRHGEPPSGDAEAAVRATIDALIEADLLEHVAADESSRP